MPPGAEDKQDTLEKLESDIDDEADVTKTCWGGIEREGNMEKLEERSAHCTFSAQICNNLKLSKMYLNIVHNMVSIHMKWHNRYTSGEGERTNRGQRLKRDALTSWEEMWCGERNVDVEKKMIEEWAIRERQRRERKDEGLERGNNEKEWERREERTAHRVGRTERVELKRTLKYWRVEKTS